MLYQIAIKVEADAFANNPYKIQVDNYLVEVRTDDRNKVIELCVLMKVKNYEVFLASVKVEHTNGLSTVYMLDSAVLYMLAMFA